MTELPDRIADVLLVEPAVIDADPHKPAICRLSNGSPRISMPLLSAQLIHRGRTPLDHVPPALALIVSGGATHSVHPTIVAGADLVVHVRRRIVQLCAGWSSAQEDQLRAHNV